MATIRIALLKGWETTGEIFASSRDDDRYVRVTYELCSYCSPLGIVPCGYKSSVIEKASLSLPWLNCALVVYLSVDSKT